MIIGSTAIKKVYSDFPREPKDLDIIVIDKNKYKTSKGVEYLENPILLKYENGEYISMDMLLTLKISHMFWDINWEKHMFDIQFLFKKGHKIKEGILEEFIGYWTETKPKIRRANLELNKEEFFNNAVNKDVVEHDILHTLINPVPMYTRLLKEGCEVELDKNKWDKLSPEDKLEVIREETYVMAYERYKEINFREGFRIQLKDNIIKHFPKYIAIFAIKNYVELERPKYNYINTIKDGLSKIK